MTASTNHAHRSAMLALFMALVVSGSVFAQGGGSGGGGQGTGSAGGGGAVGESPAPPEPAALKPAIVDGGAAVKPSGATGRTGIESRTESGAPASAAAGSPGKDFDSWLATSKEGARLGIVYERLRKSAAPALDAGVPPEAFKARIREAAAKGAAPEIVAVAIEADARRWIWLAELVRDRAWPPERTAAGFYLSAASALRNGLGEAAVRDLVIWSAASRIDPERAGAALTVAASLDAALRSRGGRGDSVARLLAASKLRIGQYDSVVALARRAMTAGISAERYMAALQETLGKGRTLTDLEEALFP